MLGEMDPLSNAIAGFPQAGRKALVAAVAPLSFSGRLSPRQARMIADAAGLDDDGLLRALLPVAAAYARPAISGFFVGAVARAGSGAVYCGANMEFPGTSLWTSLHAEQSAIAQAWSAEETRIDALAVTAAPCGLCRQFMMELGDPAALAVLVADEPRTTLAALLPSAFGPLALGRTVALLGTPTRRLALDHAEDGELVAAALAAAQRSYAPYTGTELRSGVIVTGSYAESATHNPGLPPLQMALSRRVFEGREGDEIMGAVLVAVGHAQVDHVAVARTLLTAVAPGVRLHLRSAHPA
jgi:cytidine deaminase